VPRVLQNSRDNLWRLSPTRRSCKLKYRRCVRHRAPQQDANRLPSIRTANRHIQRYKYVNSYEGRNTTPSPYSLTIGERPPVAKWQHSPGLTRGVTRILWRPTVCRLARSRRTASYPTLQHRVQHISSHSLIRKDHL